MKRVMTVLVVALCAATAANAIDFYNVATVDTTINGINIGARPSSVAFNGTDLFVGGAFTGKLVSKVADPLGTPSLAMQFGTPSVGNGIMSLDVYGNVVVSATNNAGGNDFAETHDLMGNQLGFRLGSASTGRFDGAANDPGWLAGGGGGAGVHLGAYANGTRSLYDVPLANVLDNGFTTWTPNLGSGTRDLVYDKTTGDMYIRTLNGIGRAKRVGPNNFEKFSAPGTAGMDEIVIAPDGFSSAINVEFLPEFNGPGSPSVVIGNWRTGGPVWENSINLFDVTGSGLLEPDNWYNADGSGPFAALGSGGDAWYDFSYDAGTGLLAVSDYSTEKIYFFAGQPIPEPASVLLIGLAAALIRRR